MTLNVPLCVQLKTDRAARHITHHLRDLRFDESANGGWRSATFSMYRPLRFRPDELAYFGRVYVSDARTGIVVWEGRIEDIGSAVNADGEVYDLTATGPAAHASDKTIPLIYIATGLQNWRISEFSWSGSDYELSELATDQPSIVTRVRQGTTALTNFTMDYGFFDVYEAGMKLARVRARWDAGLSTADWGVRIVNRTGPGGASPGNADAANWSTAGGTLIATVGGTNFTNGQNVTSLRSVHLAGTATAPDDTWWAGFYDVVVRTMLKNASGADITSGYSANTVLASEVVKDLLGRLLDQYDGPGATVATTTFGIEQLSYPDGITARGVLDDLEELEPGFRWGAYESDPLTGLHRFEYVQWPTDIRYEADIVDGLVSPNSGRDLYNEVRVRWRNNAGNIKTTTRVLSIPELTAAGLTRIGFVDLGDDAGSLANAERAGDQFLTEHATVLSGGRLTVAGPILDRVAGRMVMPWEIQAGYLIRLRGLSPRADALTATGRDGLSTFRIMSKEYQASSARAELELDEFTRTIVRPEGVEPPRRRRRRR